MVRKKQQQQKQKQHDPIFKGHSIHARSYNQRQFVSSILENDITFCYGPPGTGKTFISAGIAAQLLQRGIVEKIVLTRPVMEVGADTDRSSRSALGYLPGDVKSKMSSYLRPLYDELGYFISMSGIKQLENDGKLEICPLELMRGRTFNNTIMICDEAQNAAEKQIKMFLTRLGQGSKIIMSGDLDQTDLPKRLTGGFEKYIHILQDIDGLGIVKLENSDIVRHEILTPILERIEENDSTKQYQGFGA